jgi:hypothetical protein
MRFFCFAGSIYHIFEFSPFVAANNGVYQIVAFDEQATFKPREI